MRLYWIFSTFAVGGTQRRFAALAEALGGEYEHLITAMDDDYSAEAILADSVKWHRYELAVKKTGFLSWANITEFRAALKIINPNILLTSNWGTIEWRLANTRRKPTPHIHFEDGFGPDEADGKRSKKRDIARRILFSPIFSSRRTSRFVCPSTVLEDMFTDVWEVPDDRVHLIPNGIEMSRFVPSGEKDEHVPVIGSVGALRKEKRFDRLLDVFARLRPHTEVKLLLVGDGPERAALEAKASELGIRDMVEFTGARSDIPEQLARMDVYALTSDTEQMPISLVEAMACGLPVVATNVGDVHAMLAPENQPFVHERQDLDGLMMSCVKLLGNSQLRTTLGVANSAKAASTFTLETMTNKYRALFEEIA